MSRGSSRFFLQDFWNRTNVSPRNQKGHGKEERGMARRHAKTGWGKHYVQAPHSPWLKVEYAGLLSPMGHSRAPQGPIRLIADRSVTSYGHS